MIVMSIDEIREFVESSSDGICVVVKEVENDTLKPYVGHSYRNSAGVATIEVSSAIQTRSDGFPATKYFIKGFLLHELGHLHIAHQRKPEMNELNAHLWAIRKAEESEDKRIIESLKEEILMWRSLSDTRYFRKYRKASQLYREIYHAR